jgi:16S rRNA (guanine527-N7)-methyltransferase
MIAVQMKEMLQEYLPDLSSEQIYKLQTYLHLLKKWNRAYNLTSITTSRAMVIRHVLDSLSISPYLKGEHIIDIGTGAGLPGIPLSIVNPDKEFFLLDSNNKKARFLKHAKMELDLDNVAVIHNRVEAYDPPVRFDTAVARAFSSLNEFLVYSKHLLASDGQFLAMKGVYPLSEVECVEEGYNIEEVIRLEVPDLDAERHVVRVTKDQAFHAKAAVTEDEGYDDEDNSGY